ncbi:MAG: galactose oxidase [Gammaproteobacteria bacterium]|nr:galactose oxidase [Gammaproteobacteria bacterium]
MQKKPVITIALTALLAVAQASELPDLPLAVSNNAVAAVELDDGVHIVSAMGLLAGKTWRDTTSRAWHLAPGSPQWRELAPVPGPAGRLAASAVGVAGQIYLFGGYTVAKDHSEVSVPLVHALDPRDGSYVEQAAMPVPVDDTVALAYRDRYVYLVSGWHDSGNVNLVQIFDTQNNSWQQATPWPEAALFGHAGSIAESRMVICDGVTVQVTREQRQFRAAKRCLLGKIREDDISRIDWSVIPHHPGQALYRMASVAAKVDGRAAIIFAGGSPNPYNYDGIGYNGRPSTASKKVFAWMVGEQRWRRRPAMPVATMDHRGLIKYGAELLIVGGMRNQQQVSSDVLQIQR